MRIARSAASKALVSLVIGAAIAISSLAEAEGSRSEVGNSFTYQGRLTDNEQAADGTFDFEFRLFDDSGAQVGATVARPDLLVVDGLFTVQLDFGAGAFNGDARDLELSVRPGASTGAFTALMPRQSLTAAPHALALPGMRMQPGSASPNLVGGYSGNEMGAGINGATISGGGQAGFPNTVSADYGTVAGGQGNHAGGSSARGVDGLFATVGGGEGNTASGQDSTIAGGRANQASGRGAAIGGGAENIAAAEGATIAGGGKEDATNNPAVGNRVISRFGTVGGGGSNVAGNANLNLGQFSTVGGGRQNTADGSYSSVGGGISNAAHGNSDVIGGGNGNATGTGSSNTIGGGNANSTVGSGATVAGGRSNMATGGAAVGGGRENKASGFESTVAGGNANVAGNMWATIGGGYLNSASATWATIGGGGSNMATGEQSVVGGGVANTASGTIATVCGGTGNEASGAGASVLGGSFNHAGGVGATVAGGRDNSADAQTSFAAGNAAHVTHPGSFLWGDSTPAAVNSDRANQFKVRANGGARFVTSSTGLAPAGLEVTQSGSNGVAIYATQSSDDAVMVLVQKDPDGGEEGEFIKAFGGTNGGNLRFQVDHDGNVTADGVVRGGGADFAELLPGQGSLEPGDVLAIGPDGNLVKSSGRYQNTVAGVYSTEPGFLGGPDDRALDDGVPLAVVGVVPVKVTAENGPIRPGDLLVASALPGHAMRAGAHAPNGTVLGKALEGLTSGAGRIRMLAVLQ